MNERLTRWLDRCWRAVLQLGLLTVGTGATLLAERTLMRGWQFDDRPLALAKLLVPLFLPVAAVAALFVGLCWVLDLFRGTSSEGEGPRRRLKRWLRDPPGPGALFFLFICIVPAGIGFGALAFAELSPWDPWPLAIAKLLVAALGLLEIFLGMMVLTWLIETWSNQPEWDEIELEEEAHEDNRTPPAPGEGFGEKNTIFTKEAADAARKRIRAKLSGREGPGEEAVVGGSAENRPQGGPRPVGSAEKLSREIARIASQSRGSKMEAEIRYWKNPEWRVKGEGEMRTLCLILTHPVTGGRFSSFDYPTNYIESEQQIRTRLIAWANELAARSERMKGL